MAATVAKGSIPCQGIGLLSGQPVQVTLEPGARGEGVLFVWPDGETLRPELNAVVHTTRGVTLATRSGRQLSIVEHFLAATAFARQCDVLVRLGDNTTDELPLLDGSAAPWIGLLNQLGAPAKENAQSLTHRLEKTVFVRLNEQTCIYALPAERFGVTYRLDYPGCPALEGQFVRWEAGLDPDHWVTAAQTFGRVAELPALQAKGMALGVSVDNTLGILADGSFTRPLRMPDEPLYHKIQDCIGDLRLLGRGLNPLQVGMHVYAIQAGHTAHVALARALATTTALQPLA